MTARPAPEDSSIAQPDVALDMRADDAAQLLSAREVSAPPPPVDPARGRFPFCLVWSPIPVITWFLPFIGHLGIATSDGAEDGSVIYDFAGPYTIGRDSFAFGIPTRYLQCRMSRDQAAKWDDAHSCDNCHSHVAVCLENVQYAGIKRWNMVMLCFWMFFCGRYVDASGVLKSWAPSLVLLGLVLTVHAAT
ncbi:hypothetical protein PybrP1_012889 [[Pythium] brassicae (nom. inval.)]|nr:hypothetical protein PybrP1_012889 [[Pythium] brassicae (nom. inval.)]